MILALAGLAVVSLLELSLWLTPVWAWRKFAAPVLSVLQVAACAVLLVFEPAVWTALVAFFGLYRCVNLARVASGRIQADYLFHSSRKTFLWLTGFQLLLTAAAALARHYGPDIWTWASLSATAGLACTIVLLASTLRHLRTTRPSKPRRHFTEAELPSLSVAIPARNETADLEECLRSLLASTYPKLEILVLDDCSQDKRTPEIIRDFAHDGVHFIAGQEPPDSWLAKNYAYAQLTEAASGDLLLFCGVDTRFQPGSLDILVRTLLEKRKSMLSILPRNTVPAAGGRFFGPEAWVTQTNRYAWELTLPRRLLKRPPVLSTCWLITRQALEAAGGFEAVRRKGVPESYLARQTSAVADGYSFLQSTPAVGITSRKQPEEQRATAIRTRYLQMHRRPELTALIGLAEFGVLVWPLILALAAFFGGQWLPGSLSVLNFVINCVIYSKIFNLTYRRFLLKGVGLLPLAALYDIGLLNYSMWLYEFREVLWKGRNVCIPVMRVIAKLPQA
jgi:hypothetical protein